MKKLIFFLIFFSPLFAEILLNQSNLVGQELEILVEDAPNQVLEIKKPDGSIFQKQLDNNGQLKIFLDQEGVWEFFYGPQSKKLLVKDIQKPSQSNQNKEINFIIPFFLLIALLFVVILIFLGFHLYKNLSMKGPDLYKTNKEGFICITFQASKDLLENVVLQINLKDSAPIVLSKKKLLPFQKISYECEEGMFISANCKFSENNKTYNAFISSHNNQVKESNQIQQESLFVEESKPTKRKLKKLT